MRWRFGLFVLWMALLSACAPAPTPPPTALPTLTPTAALSPAPARATDRYADLPQGATALGFPQLGFPSAPASVIVYNAVDCTDCLLFHVQSMPRLLERIRNGEALLTFVPVTSPANPLGETMVRGLYCASEQNAFWRYLDALYSVYGGEGAESLDSTRLSQIAVGIGIDENGWQACVLSSRATDFLTLGRDTAQGQFGEEQFVLAAQVNNAPSPVDPDGLVRAIDTAVGAVDAAVQSAINATNTPSLASTPDPLSTAPAVVTLAPLLGEAFVPPLTLDLPEGWQQANDTLLLDDVAGVRAIPFTLFTGEVTGGIGSIVLLWRFPNLSAGNPLDATPDAPDLYTDGLRLLRLAIVEPGCNVGTDIRREYSVGGMTAVGTQFSAVDCPQLPDTRGWFAGVRWNDVNYIFYMYADPIEAMDVARGDLQAILDSLRFEG
jgi:hypothetical protein